MAFNSTHVGRDSEPATTYAVAAATRVSQKAQSHRPWLDPEAVTVLYTPVDTAIKAATRATVTTEVSVDGEPAAGG
jgi:hypothetical protein